MVVSARTGEGIAEALAAIEADLPHPGVEFEALLPYERGDLLNRIHVSGEVSSIEHTGDGTLVSGRAHADLAGELAPYVVPATAAPERHRPTPTDARPTPTDPGLCVSGGARGSGSPCPNPGSP